MHKTELHKWLLFFIAFNVMPPLMLCQSAEQQNLNVPTIVDAGKSYSYIMRALRDNWESPITYLKERGYIPKNTEQLLEDAAKLSNPYLSQPVDENAALQNNDDELDSLAIANLHKSISGDSNSGLYYQPPQKKEDGFLNNMKDKLFSLFAGQKQSTTSSSDYHMPPISKNEKTISSSTSVKSKPTQMKYYTKDPLQESR